jgi:hypothetical protein
MFKKIIPFILILVWPGFLAFGSESGQRPDPSNAALPDDEKAFFEKVQGLYYDYGRLGLKQLRCQVQDDGWEFLKFILFDNPKTDRSIKSDKPRPPEKTVEKLRFFLDYDRQSGFRFSHEGFTTTGNPEYDKLVNGVIEGINGEALLFSKVWSSITSSSNPKRGENPYLFTRTGSGYTVEFRKDGQRALFFLTDEALLSEAKMALSSKDEDNLDMKFSFQKTPQGYLLNTVSFEGQKGGVKGKIDIEYGKIGSFLMPRTVKWEWNSPEANKGNTHSSDSLVFFDYRINGTPVSSPAPVLSPAEFNRNFYGIDFADLYLLTLRAMFRAGIEFHVGFGPFLSGSPQLNRGYSGYNGTTGLGYEFSDSFSLSLDFNGAGYKSKNAAATGISLFNDDNLMLLGKYRFLTGNFRPYLLGGAGLGFTDYYTVADLSSGNSTGETDLAVEAGVGTEYQLAGDMFLFVQGCFIDDFVSAHFAQGAFVDSPTTYAPLQFGIVFER